MELTDYVKGLQKCPMTLVKQKDSDIWNWKHTLEYGMYWKDYSILLAGDFDAIIKPFDDERYKLIMLEEVDDKKRRRVFKQEKGPLVVGVQNELWYIPLSTKEGVTAMQIIKERFNISMNLGFKEGTQMYDPNAVIRFVDFIAEMAEFVQKNKIPLCLPNSRGWNHLNDLSRIAYYYPKGYKE